MFLAIRRFVRTFGAARRTLRLYNHPDPAASRMNTPPPAFAVVVLATMIILPTTVQAQADVLKSAHAFLDTFSRDITDGAVTLGTPLHVDVDGNRAYVVIPSTYDFKLKGKAVKETGSLFTFAMLKGPKGWRIVGWSWAKNNGPA